MLNIYEIRTPSHSINASKLLFLRHYLPSLHTTCSFRKIRLSSLRVKKLHFIIISHITGVSILPHPSWPLMPPHSSSINSFIFSQRKIRILNYEFDLEILKDTRKCNWIFLMIVEQTDSVFEVSLSLSLFLSLSTYTTIIPWQNVKGMTPLTLLSKEQGKIIFFLVIIKV